MTCRGVGMKALSVWFGVLVSFLFLESCKTSVVISTPTGNVESLALEFVWVWFLQKLSIKQNNTKKHNQTHQQ